MLSKLCQQHSDSESKTNTCRERHINIYRNLFIFKLMNSEDSVYTEQSRLTWQPPDSSRTQAASSVFQTYSIFWKLFKSKGWGRRNTTWINRNQRFSGSGFGTLSGDMEEGVKGYGNRVWQGGHDGQQPLSEHQVVMRELGGKETWCAGFLHWLLERTRGCGRGPLTHLSEPHTRSHAR